MGGMDGWIGDGTYDAAAQDEMESMVETDRYVASVPSVPQAFPTCPASTKASTYTAHTSTDSGFTFDAKQSQRLGSAATGPVAQRRLTTP